MTAVMKTTIKDKHFDGERPLYASECIRLEGVSIGDGESALKESRDIEVCRCSFDGRYPLWCCEKAAVRDSSFSEASRAPVWYSKKMDFENCGFLSPKSFRELDDVTVRGCRFSKAVETLWNCRNVRIGDCSFEEADYLLFRSSHVRIDGLKMQGRYSFQYCSDVEIHDSILDTKDAFWESENVTVYDSMVKGEYLAWYSRNLRLVRCLISGTQPLCYAQGLVLEDCSLAPDADLAFEYSEVSAGIRGHVTSVKNPLTGHIHASEGYGEIVIDGNLKAPGDCVID